MMNEIKLFENKDINISIRTMVINDEVWFVANDLASSLGYANPSKATNDHCKHSRMEWGNDSLGRRQRFKIVPLGDMYRLISNSHLESAGKIEEWIFDEIMPTIHKTGGYIANEELFITTYLPYADESTKALFRTTLTTVRQQNEVIKKQREEIEHKEDVIIGLVDNISLAKKRQILNRVVRYNHANYQERWALLYREFENKYHIDLQHRFDKYNKDNKPKCKTKLEYIDRVMDKIPELYEMAAKLFENDIKALVDEMYGIL